MHNHDNTMFFIGSTSTTFGKLFKSVVSEQISLNLAFPLKSKFVKFKCLTNEMTQYFTKQIKDQRKVHSGSKDSFKTLLSLPLFVPVPL